jgi:hypothetical protein
LPLMPLVSALGISASDAPVAKSEGQKQSVFQSGFTHRCPAE